MVLQPKRDYKADILKILAQEGEIIGFNTLKGMGNFHPTRLKIHLEELEKNGDITTDKSHKEYVYSYLRPKIEEKYQSLTKELQKIEISLKNPNLKPDEETLLLSNYVKLAFYHYDTFRIFSLWPEGTQFTSQQYKLMEKFQEKLNEDIKLKINKLPNLKKIRVLNVLLSSYNEKPILLTLSRYREITHKPTAQEKREQKLEAERYLQKEYEKGGTECFLCNQKLPPNYKDGNKHIEQHFKDMPKLIKQIKKLKKKN